MRTVSVITPVFEGGDLLQITVASVRDQVLPGDVSIQHLIVSDDQQDYRHLEETGHHYTCKVLTTERRGAGPSVARNVGLAHATGEYITFLDADDFWFPNRLISLLPFAYQYGAACDPIAFVDMKGKRLYHDSTVIKHSGLLSIAASLEINGAFFPLYHRSLITHPWDHTLSFSEDFLFNFMAISQGIGLYVCPDPLMAYRIRPGSLSHSMPAFSVKVDGAYDYFLNGCTLLNTLSDEERALFRRRVSIKRELNRQYTAAWEEDSALTFEAFIDQFQADLAEAG